MNDDFLDARMASGTGQVKAPYEMPQFHGHPPVISLPLKSKAIATLLSLFIPGTGQMYLGLAGRGVSIMLLLAFDIVAIVYFAAGPVQFNVLPVTLLSLLIPVLYFYNVFDAIHQTEAVNLLRRQGYSIYDRTPGFGGASPTGENGSGLLLGFIGAVVFFCSLFAFGGVWDRLFALNTAIGGILLLAVGGFLIAKEIRRKKTG